MLHSIDKYYGLEGLEPLIRRHTPQCRTTEPNTGKDLGHNLRPPTREQTNLPREITQSYFTMILKMISLCVASMEAADTFVVVFLSNQLCLVMSPLIKFHHKTFIHFLWI